MNNEFETSDGELMFQGVHIKEVNKMNMDERAEIQVKNAQRRLPSMFKITIT